MNFAIRHGSGQPINTDLNHGQYGDFVCRYCHGTFQKHTQVQSVCSRGECKRKRDRDDHLKRVKRGRK